MPAAATLILASHPRAAVSSHSPQKVAVMVAAESTVSRYRKISLRRCIRSLVSDSPDRASTAYVIESSHKLALAYLIKKTQRGSLQVSLFGLSIEDLALDSIAELFERTSDGRFPVLRAYFERYADLATSGEIDSAVALRRLVFSKVNENLFRRYHETDGNLSRIIRNIKDGTKLNEHLAMRLVKGQTWLVVTKYLKRERMSDANALYLPLTPPEVLESFFSSELMSNRRVRDLTTQFVAFTQAHPFYAPGYPLTSLARCIRSAFERTEAAMDTSDPERVFSDDETERAIARAVRKVGVEKKSSYVGRGKIEEPTFDAYLDAVEAILTGDYLYGTETESFCSALAEHLPGLSETEYKDKHRNVLEYLTKLARTELLNYMSAVV